MWILVPIAFLTMVILGIWAFIDERKEKGLPIQYYNSPTKYFLWIPYIRVFIHRYQGYIDESDDLYHGIFIDFGIFNTMHDIFIPTKKVKREKKT
jgi:hypothetical protein